MGERFIPEEAINPESSPEETELKTDSAAEKIDAEDEIVLKAPLSLGYYGDVTRANQNERLVDHAREKYRRDNHLTGQPEPKNPYEFNDVKPKMIRLSPDATMKELFDAVRKIEKNTPKWQTNGFHDFMWGKFEFGQFMKMKCLEHDIGWAQDQIRDAQTQREPRPFEKYKELVALKVADYFPSVGIELAKLTDYLPIQFKKSIQDKREKLTLGAENKLRQEIQNLLVQEIDGRLALSGFRKAGETLWSRPAGDSLHLVSVQRFPSGHKYQIEAGICNLKDLPAGEQTDISSCSERANLEEMIAAGEKREYGEGEEIEDMARKARDYLKKSLDFEESGPAAKRVGEGLNASTSLSLAKGNMFNVGSNVSRFIPSWFESKMKPKE